MAEVVTINLPGRRLPMTFRRIPKGEFRMGSRGYSNREEPAHRVRIPHEFWLGQYPVTQEQFAVWTRSKQVKHKNHFSDKPQNPAESITWWQAVEFCDWLTTACRDQFPAGCGLACLPTEAEWEYACRARSETEYYTGNGEAALIEAGWFGEEWEKGSTHPVGEKNPNDWGLYDMHGNVWEWCHDLWDEGAYRLRMDGEDDLGINARAKEYNGGLGTMLERSGFRVLRGGSWSGAAAWCRSAFRFRGLAGCFLLELRLSGLFGPQPDGTRSQARERGGSRTGARATRHGPDAGGGRVEALGRRSGFHLAGTPTATGSKRFASKTSTPKTSKADFMTVQNGNIWSRQLTGITEP